MKSLLVVVFMVVLGIVAGAGVFAFKPRLDSDAEVLALQLQHLERDVAELYERTPASPTYEHWGKLENYLDIHSNLKLDRLPADQQLAVNLGGEQWGGVMHGATLDLLMAARIAQSLIPVYFDRIAVKGDTAQMTFYVLGAREH